MRMKRRITAVMAAILALFLGLATCHADGNAYAIDDIAALVKDAVIEQTDAEDAQYYYAADSDAQPAIYVYCVSDTILSIANAAAVDASGAEAWTEKKVDAYRKYALMREAADALGYDTAAVTFMYVALNDDENAEDEFYGYYCVSDADGRDVLTVADMITSDTAPVIALGDDASLSAADDYVDSDEIYVWVSKSGKKYHYSPSCSNMKNPSEVTLDEALSRGLEPCKKCT